MMKWHTGASQVFMFHLFIYLFIIIFLFCFVLIVFLTKLYWHFLEPQLANKYNEMLKRTIEFQIQYLSQKKRKKH